MTSKQIREAFLEFFASKGHAIVPSAPVVVKNDPTLMFTNAGMNQFKDIFLGNRQPSAARVADSQKCLRVSGKHNDLEEVGHDTYHHTLFEMLGNWSFGDYFKKEAIGWAWEFLTEVCRLDKSRLYATVFEGCEADGVPQDSEALEIWKQYLPESHILTGNRKDNFWEMGDTGPCGPCSEIHIDLRDEAEIAAVPGREMVNKGHYLVIEIWNLVFMQYNRKADGSLERLPTHHVDTGMGFERLCMAVQGKKSNYDTDVFTGMIAAVSGLCGKPYDAASQEGVAMRVIADHIRAISFSIADGQLPANVKAGYVIRRILRRAVRYGYTFLGLKSPFLCRLVPCLIADMGEAYPTLASQEELITKVIREEEEAFLRTLDKGIKMIEEMMSKPSESKIIPGVDAFTLYDTYGFPIDLSELIARERGFEIDMEGFERELARQKERARCATAVEAGDWVELHPFKESIFTGYDSIEEEVSIVRYRTVKAKNRDMLQLVFDKTPFYAESGGQTGDSGTLTAPDGSLVRILDTKKENGLTVHIADRLPEDPGAPMTARVDDARRKATAANHTATHLLHFALREIVGTHIEQKGSFVCPDYFRFDFSHFEKIPQESLREVERRVNALIRENLPREEFREMDMEEARKQGAMALFGEKYGDKVRLIRFGGSAELCGGTHAPSTGALGYFHIVAESAVAAGIRRIEAITAETACNFVEQLSDSYAGVRALLNNTPDPVSALQKLIAEKEALEAERDEAARKRIVEVKNKIAASGIKAGDRTLFTLPENEKFTAEEVRNIASMLHAESVRSAFVAAFETPDGKAGLTLMYTDDLVAEGADASANIKEAAKLIQGGGGGQKSLATAGGKNIASLPQARECLTALATA